MVTGLQLASVLLVWLLSELDSSTCFPAGARGSGHPEARQSPRQRFNLRSRRPLHYIQALREANRKKPHGSPLPRAQLPHEPDPTTNRGQGERPFSFGFHVNPPSGFSKPRAQLSLSVPSSPAAQSSKTQSRNIGNPRPTEQNKPLPLGYSSQYPAPAEHISQDQVPARQSPIIAKPDLTQYPTHSLPISYYPQQHADAFSGQRNPTSDVYGEGQGGQTVSSNPTHVRPPLFEYVDSRYDDCQMNPTTNVHGEGQSGQTVSPNPVSLSQYERFPSGHYNAGQVKPSGNIYGTHHTWLPVGTRPASPPEHNSSQFKPSSGQRQETGPPSNPAQPSSAPIVAPSKYEAPFPSYNGEVPTAAYRPVDVVQRGQMDSSSSSGPSSRGQSGPAAVPDHLPAFGSSENVYSSAGYQTQTGSSGRGKPSYTKLMLDMEDDPDEGPGQTDYHPARTPLHDGHPGQNVAQTPRSMNPMSQDQQSGPLGSTSTNKPVYIRPPIIDSGVNPSASNPRNQLLPEQLHVSAVVPQQAHVASYVDTSAGSAPRYLDQQHLPKMNFYLMLVALGQHPVLWQPSRDQSPEHYSVKPPVFQLPFIQNTAPYNPYQFQVHDPSQVGVS